MKERPIIIEKEKQQICQLLDELDGIKGPEKLPDWNIRAQTLLIFIAARNPDLILEIGK